MFDYIKSELAKFNIELVSSLSLSECKLTRPYLLDRKGISDGSAIIFAVPYLQSNENEQRNVSSYAVSRDYHLFFNSIFEELIPKLETKYPDNKFAGFSDHSPINEIEAAAKANLGIIGANHLLITNKYSSFVFIGEIITDAALISYAQDAKYCEMCGNCISACPAKMDVSKCVSTITQKKGELTQEEKLLIKSQGCAWGCDICQYACPHTKSAIKNGTIFSTVDFFSKELTPHLTSNMIEEMDDESFKERAYSWRGKNIIKRNLEILEEKEK